MPIESVTVCTFLAVFSSRLATIAVEDTDCSESASDGTSESEDDRSSLRCPWHAPVALVVALCVLPTSPVTCQGHCHLLSCSYFLFLVTSLLLFCGSGLLLFSLFLVLFVYSPLSHHCAQVAYVFVATLPRRWPMALFLFLSVLCDVQRRRCPTMSIFRPSSMTARPALRGPFNFSCDFYFPFFELCSAWLDHVCVLSFSLSLWSYFSLWLYPFCFSFPCRCLRTGTCSFGGGGDVNLSCSNSHRSIDLWSRLWLCKLLCAPPLAALFAHGLCWTAFIGPFFPRFFLLWSPFVWLVNVLFVGRWLTMFVSPRSRNDAPSSVFILVPPFTRCGCFWFLSSPRPGRFCFFFFCRVVPH